MPALPKAKYGLDALYLFPLFQTREQYKQATGTEAPPFDPQRQPKFWFDPAAALSARRNVIYDRVIALADNGTPALDAEGRPVLEPLVISKFDAATVNMPPEGPAAPEIRGPMLPMPLRAPEPEEELILDYTGAVVVRNKTIAEEQAAGFGPEDRAVLRAIARKLNVSL
jgi:hypothetical protein